MSSKIPKQLKKFDKKQATMGMSVEKEHEDVTKGKKTMTAKIAAAHLKEDPAYYTKLKKMEESVQNDDQKYLDAVEGGDMEKAQKMVDAAAKAAGYNIRAYHGTNANAYSDTSFKVFHTGGERGAAFFSSRPEEANNYGEKLYNVVLSLKNPLIIDAKGRSWVDLTDAEVLSEPTKEHLQKRQEFAKKSAQLLRDIGIDVDDNAPLRPIRNVENLGAAGADTDALAKFARKYGYDGAIFRNVKDSPTAGIYKNDPQDTFAVFKSNQIKSADPVTYDDQGNIIPLSKRFNEQSNDIRESIQKGFPKFESAYRMILQEISCWSGYKKRGTKIKNGKRVNNCVSINKNK